MIFYFILKNVFSLFWFLFLLNFFIYKYIYKMLIEIFFISFYFLLRKKKLCIISNVKWI